MNYNNTRHHITSRRIKARVRNSEGVKYGYVIMFEEFSRECFDKFFDVASGKCIRVNPVDVELFTGFTASYPRRDIYEGDLLQPFYYNTLCGNADGTFEISMPFDIATASKRKRMYAYERVEDIRRLRPLARWDLLEWRLQGETKLDSLKDDTSPVLLHHSTLWSAPYGFATLKRRQWIERHIGYRQAILGKEAQSTQLP